MTLPDTSENIFGQTQCEHLPGLGLFEKFDL